jgi:hypothetical protein
MKTAVLWRMEKPLGKKEGNIAVKQEKLFENGGSQLQNARKFSD